MPLTITRDIWPSVLKATEGLAKTEVLVGIPGEEDPREDATIGNAAIGYIHEFGAPAANIPARPFLEPGVRGALDQIGDILQKGAEAAMNGDKQTSTQSLDAAGFTAVNGVIERIRSNIPPPLAPATIRRRRTRTPGSTYRRQAATAADVTALIDTGQLLHSITYVKRPLADRN